MELDIASFLYTSTYAYYIITYTVDNIKLLLSEKKRNFHRKKEKRVVDGAVDDLDSAISFPVAWHIVRHHLDKHIIMGLESGAEYSGDNKTRKGERERISTREKRRIRASNSQTKEIRNGQGWHRKWRVNYVVWSV